MQKLFFAALLIFVSTCLSAQIRARAVFPENIKRCYTEDAVRLAIQRNPAIVDQWKKKGEQIFQTYLRRKAAEKVTGLQDTIVIPVVFHIVDSAKRQSWITDRTLYDQVEILNEAYGGRKVSKYKDVIPEEIYERRGSVPLKFALARRTPSGAPTSGIERRVHLTPDHISIKSTATGGLDAWDTDLYLNVWVGTFTGDDDGLLGVATFPFLDTEGPQGVVIHIASLPFTSNVARSYFPIYAEGATLVHEVGHYFYLLHTFGDQSTCNNTDFRTQPGWDLPEGAGPEGDDTPAEKLNNNTSFGNPSMNFSDGCSTSSFGEMYGSFMNYFDDRALFMFSEGHSRRINGCIELYRSQLVTSQGALPPSPTNDAYVVAVSPYGSPERVSPVLPNVPMSATIRNYGSTPLNSVQVNVLVDGTLKFQQTFSVSLGHLEDTTLSLGTINAAAGNRAITVYTSNPNGSTDQYTENDTLQSFVNFQTSTMNIPYTQDFSGSAFPPAGWKTWNPNGDATWTLNPTSGYSTAGSASMQFRGMSGAGQLDELIMPAIGTGTADSVRLTFRHAYACANSNVVTTWDGLEIYGSNDGGQTYQMLYKKTGLYLRTVQASQTSPFTALPSEPDKWAGDTVNLSPLLNGNPLLIKFRATNSRGNNLYLDDIKVSLVSVPDRDVEALSITGLTQYICGDMPTPSVSFRNAGKEAIQSMTVNYQINGGNTVQQSWTGSLASNGGVSVNLGKLPDLPAGAYSLAVYSSNPNGVDDQLPGNDTARAMFYVMGRSASPVSEDFEHSPFPANQWVLQQNGNGHSWELASGTAAGGASSMVVRNFDYNMEGRADNLISPIVSGNAGFDSVFVTLKYAYAPGADFPGQPGAPQDTFEIRVTTNCGQVFSTLFKQSGSQLVTVSDPAGKKDNAFVPEKSDWDSLKFYLTPIVGASDFQVFITSKGNNRNNLWVDDVRIYGVTVPPLLKEQGYLIYPSPFRDQFIIRNLTPPSGMKSINIYNSMGQMVWRQQFNGDADKMVYVNSSAWSPGLYTVRIEYTNRVVTVPVVKQ